MESIPTDALNSLYVGQWFEVGVWLVSFIAHLSKAQAQRPGHAAPLTLSSALIKRAAAVGMPLQSLLNITRGPFCGTILTHKKAPAIYQLMKYELKLRVSLTQSGRTGERMEIILKQSVNSRASHAPNAFSLSPFLFARAPQ